MDDKSIGGFLELELNDYGSLYHDKAIAVNTGRNALEYILIANRYSKVYLPNYICDVVLEPLKKLNLAYSFYNIDKELKPVFNFSNVKENEALIYPNYFGLCDSIVEELIVKCDHLILDNAQAFFFKPSKMLPTFYSPRKFFGVADGGFLYNDIKLNEKLVRDSSFERIPHIIGRIEKGAEKFYELYQQSEVALKNNPLKKMSILSERILGSVNYERVKQKRQQNYKILHSEFQSLNRLNLPNLKDEVPLCYPLFHASGLEIKMKLINNKIYVPSYWPNILERSNPDSFEYDLAENLVCLPIDQRYGEVEMKKIISLILSF